VPLFLRTNTLKTTREKLQARLSAQGLECIPGRYTAECLRVTKLPPGKRLQQLPEIQDGLALVQDEASALIALLVSPKPGDSVIDLCSAPGGKTSHLAALMKNQGSLTALDINPKKISLVRQNCVRMGVLGLKTKVADARTFKPPELVDRVLVDAPCSGLGVVGKRADIRWHKAPEQITALHTLQLELLESAARMVKAGGVLVYSTCTVTKEENEGTVNAFLARNADFSLAKLPADLAPELRTADGFLRSWPQRHQIAGGFGAILVRCK
jgi:16S rRNA (cytosine967-C5)-methyltransferase